jgi:hypothetical protein
MVGSFRPRKEDREKFCDHIFFYMAETAEIGVAKSITKFTIILAIRRKQNEAVRYT